MRGSEELTADGRSADSQWFRVQTAKGAAWVMIAAGNGHAGDAATLYSSTARSHGTCRASRCIVGWYVQLRAAGAVIQRETAHLQVNGVLLSFSTAALPCIPNWIRR